MNDEHTDRVEELFQQAADLPPEARRALLDAQCGTDWGLRAEVETLLAHEAALPADFLAESPFTLAAGSVTTKGSSSECDATVPERIDRYRITSKIGEGGCGTVYLASQEDPVHRRVALKVIKLGMDTREVIARFEAERQALALMDHGNIARVYDAGATPTGRPYFVMELVNGVPITRYCDDNRLSIRERLLLFAAVCHAVVHAHQKGVIHRDIKPSNVLVATQDGIPVPKIIDFGIAKATGPTLTDRTLATEVGQLIGTPEYMSPEQATNAADVDTRSDVYSLGTVLYELLTGTTPFEAGVLRRTSWSQFQRILCETEPPRPSTRIRAFRKRDLTATQPAKPLIVAGDDFENRPAWIDEVAERRGTKSDRLVRTLRGDLDAIVLKCLEKGRENRYQAPGDLASDIGNYLDGKPIDAKQWSALYVLAKAFRRHKVAVGIAAVFLIVVGVGFATSLTLWRRAVDQRDRAVAAEKLQSLERTRASNEAAKARAVSNFLQEMLAAANPEIARKSDVTVKEALASAGQRLDAGSLATEPEIEIAVRATIGDTYFNLGLYPEADSHLRKAFEIARQRGIGDREDVAMIMHSLGETLDAKGDFDQAEKTLIEALAMLRRLFGDNHTEVGACLNELAINSKIRGDRAGAEALYRQALEVGRKVHGEESEQVATTLNNISLLVAAKGSLEEAELMQRQALSIRRKVLGEGHPAIAFSLNSLAGMANSKGDFERAEALFREALELRRKVLGVEHPDIATSMNNLGIFLDGRGRCEEAIGLHREALVMRRKLLGSENMETAASLNNLAMALTHSGHYDEAEPYFREALKILRGVFGDGHVYVALGLGNLADLLVAKKDHSAAEPVLREMLDVRLKLHGDHHVDVAKAQSRLGLCLLHLHKHESAEPILRECLKIREDLLPIDDWLIPQSRSMLGEALAGQNKFVEAEPLLLHGYSGLEKNPQSPKDRLDEALERIVLLYDSWGKLSSAKKWREKAVPTSQPLSKK